MSDPLTIVPAKPDTEIAAQIKRELMVAHEPILRLLESAKAQGFLVSIQIGSGPLGNIAVTQLQVMKQF